MLVGSLFTGIGGLDLGLERAGMTVAWQAEIDPFCCKVLAKHWPAVPNLGDVTTVNWADVPPVDLLTGGYPCQPFSLAGVRKGENDERHLWPHVRNAISVLGPRWVLLENVPGHLSLGFGTVLSDLAALGYHAEWDCLPAAAFGAPHRRDRVFIVAYPNCPTLREEPVAPWGDRPVESVANGTNRPMVSDAGSARCTDTLPGGYPTSRVESDDHGSLRPLADTPCAYGLRWRELSPIPRSETVDRTTGRGEGSRGHWAAEPDVGRVAHGVPNRVDRLRALGNAVVPQVAEHVGRLIMEAEQASHA